MIDSQLAVKIFEEIANLPEKISDFEFDAPNELAITNAKIICGKLISKNLYPNRIEASTDGGVVICFYKKNKYADIECYNNEMILAVISDTKTKIWQIKDFEQLLDEAIDRIIMFLID